MFAWLCLFLTHVYVTGPAGEKGAGAVFPGIYPPAGVSTYISIWVPFAVTLLVLAGLSVELTTEFSRARRLQMYTDAVTDWLVEVIGPSAKRNGPPPFTRTEMVRQPPLSGD
jgi:hypothetical protein